MNAKEITVLMVELGKQPGASVCGVIAEKFALKLCRPLVGGRVIGRRFY